MRKNHFPVVELFVLFVILFFHPITSSAQQVRCTGKVVDTQGRLVSGAKVAAYEMQFDGIAGNFALHKAGETKTADDGSFTFEAEPKPQRSTFYECKIVAIKPDMALGWTVWKMRENAEVNIKLGRPEKLEGVIVDDAGEPVADAQVCTNLSGIIETTEGKEKNWLPGISPLKELGAQTDSQGRFSFSNIPADIGVDLLVMAPGRAITYTYQSETREPAFKAGQTDIKVVLPAEARIEGKLIDPDTGEGVGRTTFAVVGSSLFYYRFVHTTDDDGSFSIGGLQTGEYLIRGTGLPSTEIQSKAGQTVQVTITANKPYYGRILYEDGSPVVMESEAWPGAEIRINLVEDERSSGRGVVNFDEQGYFKVYLSQEQYKKIQSRQAWFEIMIPDKDASVEGRQVVRLETIYAIGLLSTDKSKAKVAKIPNPKRRPESLVGQKLPEFTKYDPNHLQASTQDKGILVCFFDMDQRPSRNCLMQLNQKAIDLSEKDVVIVAIQSSKIDQGTLNEWIKSQNISFPVGMIQDDELQTKFSWGIKSLPWLILTDAEHVVTAEGFMLNELDEKIEPWQSKGE